MKLLFNTLLCLAFALSAVAQELPRVIPPSPEQAAINKFGDIPVSYNTGIPNISVPIYTVTAKNGLTIPISLNYHSSGIKVNEVSSNVGLGWALSAGYSISVSANGLNDLNGGMASGSQVLPQPGDFTPNVDNDPDNGYAQDYVEGEVDGQPDIFHYNMGGRSGKFVLDQDPAGIKAHTIPFEPIDIEMIGAGSTATFEITDEHGNLFIYDIIEKQSLGETGSGGQYKTNMTNMPATYYLSKVVTNDGEEITFTYASASYSYKVSETETKYYSLTLLCPPYTNNFPLKDGIMTLGGYHLTGITYGEGQGKVEFNYTTGRSDIGNVRLSSIDVKEGANTIRNFTLNQGYFDAGSGTNDVRYRLKLNSVTETKSGQDWDFGYEETVKLPVRFNKGQDHWGYYNGKSNLSLIPAYQTYGTPGADREVDESKTKANILESITYPTGGTTTFDYESNEYYDAINATNVKTAGLRVKKIISTTDAESLVTHYEYTDPNFSGRSSGEMVDHPVFADEFIEEKYLNESDPVTDCEYIRMTSSSLFSLGNSSGIAVNYTNVDVIKGTTVTNGNGNGGKTRYTYSSYQDDYSQEFYKVTSWAHRRGNLIETSVFDKDGDLMKKETNTYGFNTDFTAPIYNNFKAVNNSYILGGISIKYDRLLIGGLPEEFDYEYYYIPSSWKKLTSTTVENYDTSGILLTSQTTDYTYGNKDHQQVTKVETTNSDDIKFSTQYAYPHDIPDPGGWHDGNNLTDLINAHRIATVLEEKKLRGSSTILSTVRTHYDERTSGSAYLAPKQIDVRNSLSGNFETRINYHKYDDQGNPLEVSQEGGSHITYVWGYSKQYPVAKLENATYAQVEAALGASFDLGNGGLSATQETALRAIKGALVTTMTHQQGVGMLTQTTPNGLITEYEYDSSGRLKLIKDKDGNILKLYEYEYQKTIANTVK